MRLMSERFITDGMIPEAGDAERLTGLLGRPLHSYREFGHPGRNHGLMPAPRPFHLNKDFAH